MTFRRSRWVGGLVLGVAIGGGAVSGGAAWAQEAGAGAGSALTLKRQVVATAVEANEPVAPGDRFSVAATPQVVCFLEVANPTGGEVPVQVQWHFQGKPNHAQPIRLRPGPATRTWARLKLTRGRVGDWSCEAKDGAGASLGTVAFTITE